MASNPPILQSSTPPSLQASKITVTPQPPQTPPGGPKSRRNGGGGVSVHAPQAQEACLGRRTVWGQASKGHPGSQSLIGGSLRRPAKVSEPYWGKPQDATLGQEATFCPRALLGETSTQRLFVGSGGCLGRRWPKMAPRRPKTAPRWPQNGPR